MKLNPTRYSSAVGEVWIMLTLKIKYCHHIFDKRAIREYTDAVLTEALQHYEIPIATNAGYTPFSIITLATLLEMVWG